MRNRSHSDQWHHISGRENPADLVSRGIHLKTLDKQLWLYGPSFLSTYKGNWSTQNDVSYNVPDGDPESMAAEKIVFCTATYVHPVDKICHHFSSWNKIKCAVAWLLKVRESLLTHEKPSRIVLSVHDLEQAEIVIIKHVQHASFNQDINQLSNGHKLLKSSPIKDLDPRIDPTGIFIVGGRLQHSPLGCRRKHPVILPYTHVTSTLIVRDIHNRCHLGREWILSIVRRRFHILKARSIVYKVVGDCLTCKRLFARTCTQKMANLPEVRVDFDRLPFDHVSVDCFGPFYIKRGRSEYKRYGCIFTCLNIRAIHLEKIDDLECDTFINCMRRFVARRGKPSKIISDNGTNFTSASAELKRALQQLNQKQIQKYCVNHAIEWTFLPPAASHMNGACERMIRTVRKVLTGMLIDKCRLTDDTLHTLFVEVEGIVNHRPITKMSTDIADELPLTPAHLLLVRSAPHIAPGQFSQGDMYRRRWRYTQYLADVFWRRYLNEYIPELQRRNKWHAPERNLKIGDLVLIRHETTPRRLWPMGLVVQCSNGRDGMIRSARVKTQATELVRPITKLVLLEC